MPQQGIPPTPEPGEPGWRIVLKVAAFVAIPVALVYIVKVIMEQ